MINMGKPHSRVEHLVVLLGLTGYNNAQSLNFNQNLSQKRE